MRKGFTLIELLAVIVILAIIALIAVPIVVDIIKDSKESALFRSAEFYIDGVENAVATSLLHNKQIADGTYYIIQDGNICLGTYDEEDNTCSGEVLEIEVKGEKPTSGTITIKEGKIDKVILNISNKEIIMNSNEELDYYLAPGLYDNNNKLLASWDELVNEYGLDLENTTSSNNATDIIEQFNKASKLVIDESVTSIGEFAFYGCSGLTSIIIPSSVTNIGNSIFSGCTNLTSIKVDENNPVYDSRENSNAIIETATNTLIQGSNNTVIPSSVISIGEYAFNECTKLTSIIIPSSVTSIGDWAFIDCTGLVSITIGSGVTNIGNSIFSGCTNLTSIKVDENNPVYDSRDNSNAIIKTATNTLIQGSNNTVIPNGIIKIGERAFEGCTGLTSITIPNSVTEIGRYAFLGTGLTAIIIPGSVRSIDYGAFLECRNLVEVKILEITHSVDMSITGHAFKDCTNLKKVTFSYYVSPASNIFVGCNNLITINYKGRATGAPWGAPNATVITDF